MYYPAKLEHVIPGNSSSNWKATCSLFPGVVGVNRYASHALNELKDGIVAQMEKCAHQWVSIPEMPVETALQAEEVWLGVGVAAGLRVHVFNTLMSKSITLQSLMEQHKLHRHWYKRILDFKDTLVLDNVMELLHHTNHRFYGVAVEAGAGSAHIHPSAVYA